MKEASQSAIPQDVNGELEKTLFFTFQRKEQGLSQNELLKIKTFLK